MKHQAPSLGLTPSAVASALDAAGVSVTLGQAGLLVRHADLVVETNRHMNLTRLTSPEEVLALHIVDSLAFIPLVGSLNGTVVDIGSGAGYPGIPLAILGIDLILCESVKKKAAFLEMVVRELDLDAAVVAQRAEELAAARPVAADAVVARAVSAMGPLVELASPLLRRGGRLIALKGLPDEEELAAARATAALCGMQWASSLEYLLPTGEQRTVITLEKVGPARVDLPRRPGAAQRQPLQ